MQAYDNVQLRPASVSDGEDMDDDELQASTSVETIRHLPLHLTLSTRESRTSRPGTPSQPSSPHSSLPSPSSPSGDSVSSFPSVSSSFLFSSGPGSPPHPTHHTNDGSEHEQGDSSLIIPSLTLPVPLRRPTSYGRGLGEIRVLVLGREDTEVASLLSTLADEEYEEIVDISRWEDMAVEGITDLAKPPARILRISTDWIEYRDAHGLEKHEPSRNVELVHLHGYKIDDDVRLYTTSQRLAHV
ncbi:hypothetical protein EIP86_004040 [Pleurotus ostreatoroseus]|nr:hypothetical protein EIP86_004040 [Pleurotus ostreatoroseus]